MTRQRMDRNTAFWSKVKTGDPKDCWDWTGQIDQRTGRGRFTYTDGPIGEGFQVKVYAHRYAYETTGATIDGMIVAACDNPLCCNPAHLEDMDMTEMVRLRRGSKSTRIASTA